MNVAAWTFVMVGASFALYIGLAVWSRAKSTGDFYVAGARVHPVMNGMAMKMIMITPCAVKIWS